MIHSSSREWTRSAWQRRRNDDRGVVAGSDVLIFGVLAFVFGSLLIINVWAVIDASLAVSAAAREAARTYVESDPNTAWGDAEARAREVMADYGRNSRPIEVNRSATAYNRCDAVTISVDYSVPLIDIPIFGEFGSLGDVGSSHTERIDAYRSGDFTGECS